MRIQLFLVTIIFTLIFGLGSSASPVPGSFSGLSQHQAAESVILVQKKWPGTRKKKGKGNKGKKDRNRKEGGSGKGKCARLAEKHGLPASECRQLKGAQKCQLLARKHGLPKQECRSL